MAPSTAHRAAPPYSLPDPLDTMEEAFRYYHTDLESMPGARLWAEDEAVTEAMRDAILRGDIPLLLTLDGFPVSGLNWLHERQARVRAELDRRRRDDS